MLPLVRNTRSSRLDSPEMLLEEPLELCRPIAVEVEALADLPRIVTVGGSVRLNQEVLDSVEFNPAVSTLCRLCSADTILRHRREVRHDGHHVTLGSRRPARNQGGRAGGRCDRPVIGHRTTGGQDRSQPARQRCASSVTSPRLDGLLRTPLEDAMSTRPLPPKASQHGEMRYLGIHEDDDLDEDQLVSWIEQASSLPGEKM